MLINHSVELSSRFVWFSLPDLQAVWAECTRFIKKEQMFKLYLFFFYLTDRQGWYTLSVSDYKLALVVFKKLGSLLYR